MRTFEMRHTAVLFQKMAVIPDDYYSPTMTECAARAGAAGPLFEVNNGRSGDNKNWYDSFVALSAAGTPPD